MSKTANLLILLFAGAATNLVYFVPWLWWLVYPALSYLFFRADSSDYRGAMKAGVTFGLGMYLVGSHWLVSLVPVFHGLSVAFGIFVILFVCTILSILVGVAVLVFRVSKNLNIIFRVTSVVLVWLGADYLRTELLDWPWLKLGYSQVDSPLISYAAIGGESLLTLICISVAILLANAYRRYLKRPSRWVASAMPVVAIMIALLVLGDVFHRKEWTEAKAQGMNIDLLQANIPIGQKWDPLYRDSIFKRYLNLADQGLSSYETKSNISMAIMPETALPVPLHTISDAYWSSLAAGKTFLVAGVTELVDPDAESMAVYNAAIMHCGDQSHVYRKRRLVPFGERLPLENILGGLYRLLNLDVTNYQAGKHMPSLNCNGVSIAIAICFEIMFAQNHWKNDFDVLININEEGWYYNTFAPRQRIQYARMRAVEHARPVVSMSNNGPSAIIDHRGEIVFATSSNTRHKYESYVQGRSGSTPYQTHGAWVTLALLIVMSVLSILIFLVRNLPMSSEANS